MTSTATFVGIDIAKADFVVACRPDGASWTATNDPEGIAAAVDRMRALAPPLIVLEATGGYETALVAAWPPLRCPSWSRIRARFAISRKPPGSLPKPTAWMRSSSRSLPNGCTPHLVRCRMRPSSTSRPS